MSLEEALARVVRRLTERGFPHRLIGAAALAAHGVSRSTSDLDLLVADPAVLDPEVWADVTPPGFELEIRRGDASDPLLGVVRLDEVIGEDPDWGHVPAGVDVVVVPGPWAARMTTSDGPVLSVAGTRVTAVDLVDLVLLKLYAGGRRDLEDIHALLDTVGSDERAWRGRIEGRLADLPARSSALWARVTADRDG